MAATSHLLRAPPSLRPVISSPRPVPTPRSGAVTSCLSVISARVPSSHPACSLPLPRCRCAPLSPQPGGYFLKPAQPPSTNLSTRSLVSGVSRSIVLMMITMHRRLNAFTLDPMEHFRIPSLRNIYLVLDEQSKGIGISGIRVPPSDTKCIVSVPIAISSSRTGAGSQKRGWKETRSDLKEKGWEAKQILAAANRAISCGIPTVVIMPKGNPLWGREFVKRWSESHGLYPVKLCSCASDRNSGHFWMCDIFMPAHFGPIFMSRFACNHVKSKKRGREDLCDSLTNAMRSFVSAAAIGSQKSA